jgi:enterochelin esterase-like enzyme
MRLAIIWATASVLSAGTLISGSFAGTATKHDSSSISAQGAHDPTLGQASKFPPLVQHTGKALTGYVVTFRYWDPTATKVQITGEWSFSSPAQTTTTSSQALAPSHWAPADFPMVHPNTLEGSWPVISMAKDPATGVWSYVTPLPSGVFTYGFFVDCSARSQVGCPEVPDPSNLPWNTRSGVTAGSVETDSDVFVPSDPDFKTVNYSWQAPNPSHGSLVDVAYPSSATKQAAAANRLVIYTPPGYNAKRAAPYPTLYLSHGYDGNEVDWSTTGDASNILDNLIDAARVKPMIVVMTNFNGFADNCISNETAWATEYDQDLIDKVIPYVQAHYNVSREVSQRSFAGISCGGELANTLLITDTGEFGYYGVMSPYGSAGSSVTPAEAKAASAYLATRRKALNKVGIFIGGGLQDPIHSIAVSDVDILKKSGIRLSNDFIDGGHEWYVWRILLRDFLTRVAFLPLAG